MKKNDTPTAPCGPKMAQAPASDVPRTRAEMWLRKTAEAANQRRLVSYGRWDPAATASILQVTNTTSGGDRASEGWLREIPRHV